MIAALFGGAFVFLLTVLFFMAFILFLPDSRTARGALVVLAVAVGIGAALDSIKGTLKMSGKQLNRD
jgi:di/tricarboxylate transporter